MIMYQAWGMRRETGENKIVTYPFPTVWFWHDPLSAQATAGGVGSAGSHPARPKPSAPQHPDWQGFTTQNKAAAFGAHANFRFKATPRREGKSWAENGVVMGVGGR